MAQKKKDGKKNTVKDTAKAATNETAATTPEKPVKTSSLGFPTR